MSHLNTAPETKAAGADLALAFEDLRYTLENYRATNEERLAGLEARQGADPLTEEKLVRMDAALDDTMRRIDRLTLERARPALGQDGPRDPLTAEHKAAFASYVRTGEAGGLKRLEAKALSAGSGPDGGYLAPATVEGEILRRLANVSPIRSLATVRTISSGTYKKAFSTTGPASGWVAETAARPQGSSPTLAELSFPAMELYAMPAATQTLLDDAIVDIDQWIAEEVESAFAEQEGAAFVTGDGVDKPKGFLAYPTIADASWSWGNIGVLNTGVAGAFPASNPADVLIDLVYALKAGYRQNASFVMNRKVQATVRKFKDANGHYLWQPPASAGAPATLLGFPLVEAEDMPNIATSAVSIAFGDFRRGYLVVDRAGVRILRDPYSAKPYVLFYTTKRVGGGIQDFAAIKGLKFAV
ncbi:capsid protein [Bosea sp. Root670]|uniref:phage major capsid protein n=1 Tax=Bosea sp. Root670 TaxID=1736583 RepID=UPI000714AEF9|nr:phage major capsid protein [Bosea sp. Root670]KRE08548.1 capsid protein [Bosea sp. Root670]